MAPFSCAKLLVAILATFLLSLLPTEAQFSGCQWTDWFSEERGGRPSSDLGNFPIRAMDCRGGFCNDIRYEQCKYGWSCGPFLLETKDCEELYSVSEEKGENKQFCPHGKVVTGIACSGSNCDNLVLTCCKPRDWELLDDSAYGYTEIWTGWFSEDLNGNDCSRSMEQAPVSCPDALMTGLECCGSFCDNKRLHCMEMGGATELDLGR